MPEAADPHEHDPEPTGRSTLAEPSGRTRIIRVVGALVGVVVAYYAVPVGEFPSSWDVVLASVGLLVGLGILVFVAVRQLRVLSQFEAGDPSVRLDVLGLLVVIFVPLFALGYFALEQGDSGQFDDLETKTDALYFTLSTLATVGFGDVHAAGQLARGLVMVQIVFDVVFVALLVSIVTNQIKARAAERRAGSER